MYDLGSYPTIIAGGYHDIIKVDVMYCSKEVFDGIKSMEVGAGYTSKVVNTIDKFDQTDDNIIRANIN